MEGHNTRVNHFNSPWANGRVPTSIPGIACFCMSLACPPLEKVYVVTTLGLDFGLNTMLVQHCLDVRATLLGHLKVSTNLCRHDVETTLEC